MNDRKKPFLCLSMLLLALALGGCATANVPQRAEDTRLDQLLSGMEQSLANQATFNTQLQEQQQRLALQQQQLESLSQGLGKKPPEVPPAVNNCPKAVACPSPDKASNKLVVGQLEQVWLSGPELALTARIDTGAETSSLDARNINLFERDGKRWVRFEIINPTTGKPESLERRLKRTVGIHQSGTTAATRRPVVKMGIVIGGSNQSAEFTLSDRSHLGYQVLIGRNILKDVMVVDVSKINNAPYILPDKSPGSAGVVR
jgi:hypothetical protein